MASVQLEGKVAIVTGGSRGIGGAIARALCERGARVALVSRSSEELERAASGLSGAGSAPLPIAADVTNPESVAALVEQVEQKLGAIDVLVAGAGRFAAIGRAWELSFETWWREVEVNLLGSHSCCREVLKRMVPRGRGALFLMSSVAGVHGPHVHASAYGVSKLALAGYAETLARETAEFGIRVFAVDPGPVRTAMTEPLLRDPEKRAWVPGFACSVERGDDVPASAAAELVLKLLTERAAKLTGRFVGVRDDFEWLVAHADEVAERELHVVRLRGSDRPRGDAAQ